MLKKFIDLDYGEEGMIKAFTGFENGLNDIGIYRGKIIRMLSRSPVRKNVIVSIKGCRAIMSPEMASEILVEPAMEMEYIR